VDFEELVAPHRRELHAHCYRMLGSVQDAEDALQEALLAAWRGLSGFEGRSSLRAWLYKIATNACLRLIERRPKRILTPDYAPPRTDTAELGEPVLGPIWLEPWIDGPEASYLEREGVELAFVAALQHLPGTQRATLILRDVLGYSAAETAELLDTTPASINSAMQRARAAVASRVPERSQQAELAAIDQRALVDAFVRAWERADLDGLVALLAEDAQFTMPPLPAWFDGRADVAMFLRERVFAMRWRLVELRVNGQLGFGCYVDGQLAALNVLTVRDGLVTRINGFTNPTELRRQRHGAADGPRVRRLLRRAAAERRDAAARRRHVPAVQRLLARRGRQA
jgi:RNA polymerase sigma-70 factor (ECF subfamily)